MSALAAVCVVAAAISTTAAAPATTTGTISRTITVMWPARPFAQMGYLRPLDIDSHHVESVSAVFPGGVRVESGRQNTVVACRHNGASYATLGWVRQGTGLWVTIVLQTGQCAPGPSVAGKPVTIRLDVRAT
jgi:hypothetical protein